VSIDIDTVCTLVSRAYETNGRVPRARRVYLVTYHTWHHGMHRRADLLQPHIRHMVHSEFALRALATHAFSLNEAALRSGFVGDSYSTSPVELVDGPSSLVMLRYHGLPREAPVS